MKLIADSGATNTTWIVKDPATDRGDIIVTGGINAVHTPDSDIDRSIDDAMDAMRPEEITDVEFYGAGCIDEAACLRISSSLRRHLPTAEIEVASDLLGAARGLLGTRRGIACILGTGSNSCLYDGHKIVDNVSPLGYILGDEGSGAVLGKRLVGAVLKRQLPPHICEAWHEQYRLTIPQVVQKVYREPGAARWLGSLAPFLKEHIEDDAVHSLVMDEFDAFFRRNVALYKECHELEVCFTGSVAWHFSDVLKESARAGGFQLGIIKKAPFA